MKKTNNYIDQDFDTILQLRPSLLYYLAEILFFFAISLAWFWMSGYIYGIMLYYDSIRPSQEIMWFVKILPFLVTILLGIALLIKRYMQRIKITRRYIYFTKGILNLTTQQISIHSISGIKQTQNVLDRLCNCETLYFNPKQYFGRNYAGTANVLSIQHVPKSVFTCIENIRQSTRKESRSRTKQQSKAK